MKNSPERCHNLPTPQLCRSAKKNRSRLASAPITSMAEKRKQIDLFSPIWRAQIELY
jgi:hypothetical protein